MSRNRRRASAVCLAALVVAAGCTVPARTDPRLMTFPSVTFSPPAPARLLLENGLVLYLLRDTEVPLAHVRVLIRTGAVLEPPDRVGLADLVGRVLRTGGTRNFSGAQLNEKLELMGARLETSIGSQHGAASLSVLSDDLETGMELLAEVLRYPAFSAGELERVKNRTIEGIRRGNDEPDSIANREFRTAVYGDDPRGRQASPEGVAAIQREDLVEFHRKYFHPDRLLMGVSGDVTETEARDLVEKYFGDWQPYGISPDPFPSPGADPDPQVNLADKDFPQTTILIGHLAPPRNSPEYYGFRLLNYILGGGSFNSRLVREIRSNLGLAYSVGSSYRGDIGYGVFVAYCKTKPESTIEAVRLMQELMEAIQRDGVSAGELRWAKDAIINGLVFSVDSTSEVVARRMFLEYDGLPNDFLEKYREHIEGVTTGDILAVARDFLKPRTAVMVVVGEDEKFDGSLEEFGPINRLHLKKY